MDKLTSYNGKAITYDSIGNPLKVGSDTYTWQNGRELASSTIGGKKSIYTYDSLRLLRLISRPNHPEKRWI